MFTRLSTLAAATVLGSLTLGIGAASAAQCTTSATPVCARTSCSITVPVTCTCREWKCVEKGGRGTAIATRGVATQLLSKPTSQSRPLTLPPKFAAPIVRQAPKLNFVGRR